MKRDVMLVLGAVLLAGAGFDAGLLVRPATTPSTTTLTI